MEHENCLTAGSDVVQPLLSFEEVGERFGKKSARTVRRWVETVPGFPQPVRIGASRLFVPSEVESYLQKLKQQRNKQRNQK
jgi:predicted DNA-binding transcriptional regulator AlpA